MDIERLRNLVNAVAIEAANVIPLGLGQAPKLKAAIVELRNFAAEQAADADRDDPESFAEELKACETSSALDEVLGAARKHCYSVTFRFSDD